MQFEQAAWSIAELAAQKSESASGTRAAMRPISSRGVSVNSSVFAPRLFGAGLAVLFGVVVDNLATGLAQPIHVKTVGGRTSAAVVIAVAAPNTFSEFETRSERLQTARRATVGAGRLYLSNLMLGREKACMTQQVIDE